MGMLRTAQEFADISMVVGEQAPSKNSTRNIIMDIQQLVAVMLVSVILMKCKCCFKKKQKEMTPSMRTVVFEDPGGANKAYDLPKQEQGPSK
ncbi:hypothetical protein Y032_0224g2740 [Ancylostoma ceylanicum]|nr:hypothetical protein Y032_0224g2740 [Ancylostoma ceylanicum]